MLLVSFLSKRASNLFLFCLSICYLLGDIVKQDSAQAAHWFRRASENGDADAMMILSGMHFEGHGVTKDLEEALRWCDESANVGGEDDETHDRREKILEEAHKIFDADAREQHEMLATGWSLKLAKVATPVSDLNPVRARVAGDNLLHVACRKRAYDSIALLFEHPQFDVLVSEKNAEGELPCDVVSDDDEHADDVRALLGWSRSARVACLMMCWERSRLSQPEPLGSLPVEIVQIVGQAVLSPFESSGFDDFPRLLTWLRQSWRSTS
jgi:Sel1 repeat